MSKKVLIVDDDEMLLRATARGLKARGWTVSTASGSVVPSRELAEVALLDWEPHGPDMAKRCQLAGIPFVVYTGNFPEAETLRQQGIMALTKPALTVDLSNALEAMIDVAKGDPERRSCW